MALLNKYLRYLKDGIVTKIALYSAKADCLDTTSSPHLCVKMDDTTGYAGLVKGTNAGNYPTALKVKHNNETYTVQSVGYHTVTITQSSNQTIKVTCNGTTYTSSFVAPYGATYTVSITPSTGYNAGTLNKTSGTVTSAVSISATAASLKTFTVTITQSSNQTITVTYNGTKYTSNFTATYGSTYTATISASTGYNAGTLSSTSGTITSAITVSATAATKKNFTVTITQSSNQTIKVTCNGTTYTSTFTAPYGSTYTVTVTPATNYNAGKPNVTSGTVTGNVSISASAATMAIHPDGTLLASVNNVNTVTFTTPANCRYISIAAQETHWDKGGDIDCIVVKRVPVTPNTTYTIKGYTGRQHTSPFGSDAIASGYNFYYIDHATLGRIPAPENAPDWTDIYRIYTDDGQGVVYADAEFKTMYKNYSGKDYPT